MKTEAIRLCIQAQYGKEDYEEARKELNALLARVEELESGPTPVAADKKPADLQAEVDALSERLAANHAKLQRAFRR